MKCSHVIRSVGIDNLFESSPNLCPRFCLLRSLSSTLSSVNLFLFSVPCTYYFPPPPPCYFALDGPTSDSNLEICAFYRNKRRAVIFQRETIDLDLLLFWYSIFYTFFFQFLFFAFCYFNYLETHLFLLLILYKYLKPLIFFY